MKTANINLSHHGMKISHPEITQPYNQVQREDMRMRAWLAMQRGVAALALAALSPVVVAMWLAVKLTSKGPFLFKQERPGMSTKTFTIYKVRTMASGSEKQTALGVTRNDPKVTRVGKVLRKLKLDELPQLWNIVVGDMAIVGPRPIPKALDAELRTKIPGFEQRYEVPPGLTSIGQICVKDNALGDKLVEDWKIRFEGELHYMRNRSVRYDLLIISMTCLFVITRTR